MRNIEAKKQYDRQYARQYRLRNLDYCRDRDRKRIRTPEKRRRDRLKWEYNITPEEWNALFESQDSRCAICKTTEPGGRHGWHTDHCHQTNEVRGILCNNCNMGLGYFRDNPTLLKEGKDYLQKRLLTS